MWLNSVLYQQSLWSSKKKQEIIHNLISAMYENHTIE